MNTALLQLRMRTLDAQGERLPRFIERVRGVIKLAQVKGEHDVARELTALSLQLTNLRGDAREVIYAALDRALAKSHQS